MSTMTGTDMRALVVCIAVAVLIAAIAMLAMAVGAVPLSIGQVLDGIGGGKNAFIVTQYRAPRVVISILSGASFGIAGVLLQGALRNPLASPDVVGITKWAGLGAFLAGLMTPAAWAIWAIPAGVMLGAISGAALLLALGRSFGGGMTALALVGVALGMLAQALMQYVMILYPSRTDQSMVWLAGSVYGSTVVDVLALTLWLLACLPLVLLAAARLDAGGFGDDTLISLGMSPGLMRSGLILTSIALCAGSVASVGSMGFLGLLAPHAARLLVGSRAKHLLPASGLIGALTLSVADLIGRLIALPNEIPAGIVAAVIGGPYLIFLLVKEAGRHD
ncbi:FecCD family ABC transporter permease [Phyllobacterium endophyticum]|uniref:Iron ABC transporter permease n=1 Tax=Phyllobacterium endophyticum TaxID=1149773 RepID=A0A2P7B1W7_9HYPH|nr:iron ABC transporter permease [Phyllobacterium endophyticum]MBB3238043.1 iron complex transport system permease protein [Phyllobacterium endophyticum]PSH60457.1 iron ABC transporter permease [Phyllobacterium endophyticum]TYR42634.1 iron ABC transporter permease [Phyllobacterium endophyticum]